METRECNTCHENKEMTAYYIYKGYKSHRCIACTGSYQRDYRNSSRGRIAKMLRRKQLSPDEMILEQQAMERDIVHLKKAWAESEACGFANLDGVAIPALFFEDLE